MLSAEEAIAKGYQARKDGDLETARDFYTKGATLYREQSNSLAYAHSIRHIADIDRQQYNPSAARPLYEEALGIYRADLNTKLLDLANTVRPYALLLEEQSDRNAAKPLWEEARNLYASLRLHEGVEECERHIASTAI